MFFDLWFPLESAPMVRVCVCSVTCHPTQVNVPRLPPAGKVGTRLNYPGGMEG